MMDPSQWTSLGTIPALVILVGYLLVNARSDRIDYRRGIVVLQRKATELERRVGQLEKRLDAERELRRAAEDRAAMAERRLRLVSGDPP